LNCLISIKLHYYEIFFALKVLEQIIFLLNKLQLPSFDRILTGP
jgi:hypothetical protein